MPYPVLPPPPPPLVETIPSDSIPASENELGAQSHGGNVGSGAVSKSASESTLSENSLLSEPATSADEARASLPHSSQEQHSHGGGVSTRDSGANTPLSTSSSAQSSFSTLVTLDPTPPENFSPEFSTSANEIMEADVTSVSFYPHESGLSGNTVRANPHRAIASGTSRESSNVERVGGSVSEDTVSEENVTEQSTSVLLNVDRLLEEGAIASQQRLTSTTLNSSAPDSPVSLVRVASEESVSSGSDPSVLLLSDDSQSHPASTTTGIPPLNVDQLLAEGLEGFRARSVQLETVRQTESLSSATDNASATQASALGGRISVWPQENSEIAEEDSYRPSPLYHSPPTASDPTPNNVSQRNSPQAVSSSEEQLTAIGPTQQPSELQLPSAADAEELEAAAVQYYESIQQDMDLASAQLIEPLGETFSALYNLAQEWVEERDEESQDVPDGDSPDAFPTIPEPEEGVVPESAPILVIPVDEPEETPQDTDDIIDEIDDLAEPDTSVDDLAEPNIDPEAPDVNPELDPIDGSLLEPPAPGPSGTPIDIAPGDVLELTSDRQTYDTIRRVFIAEGNVEMLVRGVVLTAERVEVNLPNKIAVAQENVVLRRGQQVLRGDRIEYSLVNEDGIVSGARGEVFIPQIGVDTEVTRTDTGNRVAPQPLSGQLSAEQPPIETATTTGSLTIGIGSGSSGIEGGGASGNIRQIRFEADNIDFNSQGWEATNVRITNDPFSPPELEIRTNRATFRRLSPTRSELIASNPRLVFDQGFSLPLFRRRFVFDDTQRDQGIVQFGFDREDRGGLYIERTFEPIVTPFAVLSVRPQYFIQRALGSDTDDETASPDQDDNEGGLFDPDSFGLVASLDVDVDALTSFEGRLEMTSLDLADFDDEGRGSARLQRGVLPILHRGSRQPQYHTLTAEYSYRDRLFNGTLGFQTVQRTFGLVFTSPTIQLTGTPDTRGLELTYQAAIQRINANVALERREDLLPPPPLENVRTSLTRYQVAAELERFYFLWIGNVLPATPDEGLKYTPAPVVPFIGVIPSIQGVASFYSSGDAQPILTGKVTLLGQFGNFSRPFLDYFGFNLSYERSTEGSESPFNFDRENDREVVSGGATAQIYGPLRAGFRTSISIGEDEEFDNSFFLEYSRRTYGIVLSFNPDRETGSLTFRLSDFTWTGTPEPFGGSGVRTVEDGIVPVEPGPGSE